MTDTTLEAASRRRSVLLVTLSLETLLVGLGLETLLVYTLYVTGVLDAAYGQVMALAS